MDKFIALSENKLQTIKLVLNSTPSFSGGWLKFFRVDSEILFDNLQLSDKMVTGGIWTSGAITTPYAYEIVRLGENFPLDIDRHFFSNFGAGLSVNRTVFKDFREHNSEKLPEWY